MDTSDGLNRLHEKVTVLFSKDTLELQKFIAFLTLLAFKSLPREVDHELQQIITEKNYQKLFHILIKHNPENILRISDYFLA